MRLGVFVVLAGIGFASAGSLAAFEGSIQYRLTDKRGGVHDMTITLVEKKMRTDMVAGNRAVAAIIDEAAHTVTTLMPDRKAYMISTFDPDQAGGGARKGTLRKTGATDTVAGYAVEEWVYESGKTKTSLWITNKLGAGFFQSSGVSHSIEIPSELRGKGLALRIQGDKGFKMEALKVMPGAPKASLFTVPANYSNMSLGAGETGGSPEGAGMPSDAQSRMQKAMENMTPEQKAMIEKMMQNQGAPAQ